ncbi:TetR/AcrR family transcriptional regulator [Enterococcus sp. LJL90]
MKKQSISELITDCFIELLLKKNFKSISITELTKKVKISRVTFYKNFENKEDILDTLIEKLLGEFDSLQQKHVAIFKKINMTDNEELKGALLSSTLEVLNFFCNHEKSIRALSSSKNLVDFMDLLHLTYYNQFTRAMPDNISKEVDQSTLNCYATFITTGVNAVIEQWFQNGFQESPATIAEILTNMLTTPLQELHLTAMRQQACPANFE